MAERPTPAARPAATGVASPCIGVCRMHAGTGWCEGCLRTIDEIAGWSRLADDGKHAVLRELPARRRQWRALQAAGAAPADAVPPASAA